MDCKALTAVQKGTVKELKELLARGGVSIDARDDNGLTLLHHAASSGQPEVIQCLLENGADILATTDKHNTVLHIAVTRDNEEVVKAVLENVARDKLRKLLDAKTKATGKAALHVAAKQKSLKNALILLQHGANYEIRNSAGKKPINLAASQELRGLLRLIDRSFAKAMRGDTEAMSVLGPASDDKLLAALNCRNDEGRTVTQLFILHHRVADYSFSTDDWMNHTMIHVRFARVFDREMLALREPSRKCEIDDLARRVRSYRESWFDPHGFLAFRDVSSQLEKEKREGPSRDLFETPIGRAIGLALDKVRREVLLKFGNIVDSSPTIKAAMRSLEDIYEIFDGFDLDKLRDGGTWSGQQSERHQVKLPAEWKDDVCLFLWVFMERVEDVLYHAIITFESCLFAARLFHAVKDNDLGKAQRLIERLHYHVYTIDTDETTRTIMCYAVENGNAKMVKLLLRFGTNAWRTDIPSPLYPEHGKAPLYLAVSKGHAKIVKLLLEKTKAEDSIKLINYRGKLGSALHVAAQLGRLDLVNMLLMYGASYETSNAEGCTPLDLSTSEEVTELLGLVDSCFQDAKQANTELVNKLKAMPTDLFLAVAGAKNEQGQTLAVVAGKANAKSIARMILRMIREVKDNEV